MPGNIVEAVKRLLEELSKEGVAVERAYLFGSYVKGSWIKTSDIDLVVVSRNFEGMSFTERLDLINRLQWRAGITPFIEAIPLTPRELEERIQQSVVLRDASKYWVEVMSTFKPQSPAN
ncbi:MAG: nucleotidyltransferase domain-containing protein [Sulfolobales archaeon]